MIRFWAFCYKRDPGWAGYPTLRRLHGNLPALAGYPTYHVNVIKIK